MKPTILLIETSTDICSVAISEGEKVLDEIILDESRQQASRLAPLVDKILSGAGMKITDIDAVAVSEGPGSYTGLRVGVSTAKGLCFGANIPLIAVNTMDILFAMAKEKDSDYIIPVIDARRMEVYQAVYSSNGTRLTEQEPKIIGYDSYRDLLKGGKTIFIGTGAAKIANVILNENAIFTQCCPLASFMAKYADTAFSNGDFKDVAYFEPYYLKDFIAGTTKKDPLKWL